MIRKAELSHLGAIMECIVDAQRLLHDCGVDQWQDGYPTIDIIRKDIERGESYILIHNGVIVATAVISFAGEVTYNHIEGSWLNDNRYAVIHRLAVRSDARNQGLATHLFDYTEQLCHQNGVGNIRVDTHKDNLIMQRLLGRLGYLYCGNITLLSGAKRIALQKVLR